MAAHDYSTLSHASPYLTDERVSKALSDWFGEDVTFSHWEYVGEISKGDSMLSDIMRLKIHGNSKNGPKSVQVFLKTFPKSIARQLTYRIPDFFRNEINFFQKVMPALVKFESTRNVKTPFTRYPKTFLTHSDGVTDVLALIDASLAGYQNLPRHKQVDFEHCKWAFTGLAQFHALSFAMRDQEKDEFEKVTKYVDETYFAEQFRDWYSKFWKRISAIAIDAVEKEYPDTIYLEKVKEFARDEKYWDKMIAACTKHANGVITHGDCWIPNFLFKYDNDTSMDVMLIDFQLARCASPVLDIGFFVYSCTSHELRMNHYNELIEHYYAELSSRIRELGSDPDKVYSKEVFKAELKRYMFFGLGLSFESTAFVVLGPEDEIDMTMEGDQKKNIDDVWQVKPFKTKEDRLRSAYNLVHCVDNGYI